LRPSVSCVEVGTPVPEAQGQVNLFVEEEELTDIDNENVARHPQRARKHPLEFILQKEVPRVRSRLRFVSEYTNFTMRCL